MIKLNLLRFLDKSFSEIYQITHGELQLEDEDSLEFTPQEIEKPAKTIEENKGKKNLILIVSIAFSVLIILSLSIGGYFYYKLKVLEKEIALKKQVLIKKEQKMLNTNHPKPIDNKPQKEDFSDDIAQFKPIGEIVFIDEDKTDEKKVNIDQKKDLPHKEIKQRKEYTSEDTNGLKFSLVIEDCYPGDIEKIRNLLKEWKLSYVSHEKEKVKIMVYKAYKYAEKSDIYIGNKPVLFLGYFYNKDEAISFLRENSLKGVITSKMEEVVKYEVIISTFNSESDISTFLAKAKLNNKKFRINKS